MQTALPMMDFLLSSDRKSAGVLVRIPESLKFDPDSTKELLAAISETVRNNLLPGAEYRMIGPSVIRQAILRDSVRTAIIFGLLCTLICAGVTVYVFKSGTVTAVTLLILGTCVIWVLGLMSIFGIPLGASTSISFGLILITTLEVVIHIIIRFNQFRHLVEGRIEALRETLRYQARPLLFTALTTAIGFGTLVIAPLPMVFQLGATETLGIMISLFLAMVLVPRFIISTRLLDAALRTDIPADLLDRAIDKAKGQIVNHHKLFTSVGICLAVIFFAGAPLIKTDSQYSQLLGESSKEIRDVRFAEKNLTAVHSVELMLEAENHAFKSPGTWEKVSELEKRLKEIPDVVNTDSFFSALQYGQQVVGSNPSRPEELFENPQLIPQLFFLASSNPDGNRRLRGYTDEDFNNLHISIRVRNTASESLIETINRIQSTADSVMKGVAKPIVTGELVVTAMQGYDLVRSQILAVILALGIIMIVMMIYMGAPFFGLISLIPGLPRIAVVLGMMGWFGITLNIMTVFAATIAVAFAANNTIQFLAQLRREVNINPGLSTEQCMFNAYGLAARPIIAWSVVTALGFLVLAVTPYWAAKCFGILVSSAVLMGTFGDLVFMQSLILTFPGLRKLIRRMIENTSASME
jgi:predicted RND superfamily exporter protein